MCEVFVSRLFSWFLGIGSVGVSVDGGGGLGLGSFWEIFIGFVEF